jgi:hypothetical protein
MFWRATILAFCLIAAESLLAPTSAPAQDKTLQFRNLKGKIVAMSGRFIQWTDPTNAVMYVRLDKKTKTQVTGEVDPSFLSPGMFVRFPAVVTKRGKIEGDVGELTVFNPADGFSTGIFEDGVSDPKAASAKYFIAGQIQSTKNGETTVRVGNQSFKFQLTDDAKLNIEVSDYSIAKPDDEITITGSGLRKDQIEAKEIEIKLGKPLSGVAEKSRRPNSTKRPSRKPEPANAGEGAEQASR